MSVTPSLKVAVIGAGPAGCFAALCLRHSGLFSNIEVFEKRPREDDLEKGRNVNITLCRRGLDCLAAVGIHVGEGGLPTVPMTHFKRHGLGSASLRLSYAECIPSNVDVAGSYVPTIHSVQRRDLYDVLLAQAEKVDIPVHFEHEYLSTQLNLDHKQKERRNIHLVKFKTKSGVHSTDAALVIGADGIHSRTIQYIKPNTPMVLTDDQDCGIEIQDLFEKYGNSRIVGRSKFGYREIPVPYDHLESAKIEIDTFHIWANENMIVLGLPTVTKTMTFGIYAPTNMMKCLSSEELVSEVVREFPGLSDCLSNLFPEGLDKVHDKDTYRVGTLQTGYTPQIVKDGVVVIGDAAHAMLPFLGQGLNSGLEDSHLLVKCLEHWASQCEATDHENAESLHRALVDFGRMRTRDLHVIQVQSQKEMLRMLQMQKMMKGDLNAMSEFFCRVAFTHINYMDALPKAKSEILAIGTPVKKGDILTQVESVKTLVSFVATYSGTVSSVEVGADGVPVYGITPSSGLPKQGKENAKEMPSLKAVERPDQSASDIIRERTTNDTISAVWDIQKESSPFQLLLFQNKLATSYIGRCLFYVEETGSTMDDAKVLSDKGCLHGSACLAETMTAGRGRQSSKWTAPPRGNIYVTFVLKIHAGNENHFPKVQFAGAVAVCNAIREMGVRDAVVKWPNDVWVRGRKICGVLVEVYRNAAVKEGKLSSIPILLGIGVNVNDDPRMNEPLRDKATSINAEVGHVVSREEVLAKICNELEYLLDMDTYGVLHVFQEMHLFTSGSVIDVFPKNGKSFRGLVKRITDKGGLEIQGDESQPVILQDLNLSVRPVPESTIYVYSGVGCSEQSRHMVYTSLKMHVDTAKYRISFIDPETLIKGEWMKEAALIVFGGGYDEGYIDALGSDGISNIRQFVNSGGSYLGICAGGYFGCSEIEFDKAGPLEVCGSRELGFFPGKCVGPVFPGFKYNTEDGAHAAKVLWRLEGEHGRLEELGCAVYFNGGGTFVFPEVCFTNDRDSTPTNAPEILARYETLLGNPAAVVKCKVGQGVAVLSGVHFEYNVHDLKKCQDGKINDKIIPALEASSLSNYQSFKIVMKHLGVS